MKLNIITHNDVSIHMQCLVYNVLPEVSIYYDSISITNYLDADREHNRRISIKLLLDDYGVSRSLNFYSAKSLIETLSDLAENGKCIDSLMILKSNI